MSTRMTAGLVLAFALCAASASAQGGATKADTAKKPPATQGAATKQAPPQAKQGGATKAPAKADTSKAKPDTMGGASISERGSKGQMSIMREVYSYSAGGRRDPFLSLMSTGEIRPLITEVEVIGIVYDESGPQSEAILRNTADKKTQYRVKVGQTLGRMRIAQITRRDVVFNIEEFGLSRQVTLSVKPDTSKARTP